MDPTGREKDEIMGLSEVAEKLAEYQSRLAAGQVSRIRPEHVDRVIRKLESKRVTLAGAVAEQERQPERERLERKLGKVEDLIDQARWLREQI